MPYSITNGLCTLADVKAALNITDTADDDAISRAIDSASRLIEAQCNRRFWQDPLPRSDAGCVLTANSATVQDSSIVATDQGRSVSDGGVLVASNAIAINIVPGTSFQLATFDGDLLPVASGSTKALTIGLAPHRFVSNDPWLVEVDDISTNQGLIVQTDYAGDGSYSTLWSAGDFQTEPVNQIMQGQAGWPTVKLRAIRSLYFPVWGGISYPKPFTQALVQVTARWGWQAVPSPVNEAAIIQAIATFKAKDVPFGATPFPETGILRLAEYLHPTAAMLIEPYRDQTVMVA